MTLPTGTQTYERRPGCFYAFSYPQEISGVSGEKFLASSGICPAQGRRVSYRHCVAMQEWMARLDMDPNLWIGTSMRAFPVARKRRSKILQLAILEPEFAVLDGQNSGLDVDALRVVANGIREVHDSP